MTTTLRSRIFLASAATAALLALASIVVEEASAGSGGIGPASAAEDEREPDRYREAAKYSRIWDSVSNRERRWARRTSECESGGDPNAIGGGGLYRGAFQFMRSTWKSSPKSPGGDPIDYSYRTQAVVAVMLKRRDGAGHWPVCG